MCDVKLPNRFDPETPEIDELLKHYYFVDKNDSRYIIERDGKAGFIISADLENPHLTLEEIDTDILNKPTQSGPEGRVEPIPDDQFGIFFSDTDARWFSRMKTFPYRPVEGVCKLVPRCHTLCV